MRLTALALAATLALPSAAQTEPTIWGNVIKIGGAAALVKTIIDVVDWVRGKRVPNPQTLHYCAPSRCNFTSTVELLIVELFAGAITCRAGFA